MGNGHLFLQVSVCENISLHYYVINWRDLTRGVSVRHHKHDFLCVLTQEATGRKLEPAAHHRHGDIISSLYCLRCLTSPRHRIQAGTLRNNHIKLSAICSTSYWPLFGFLGTWIERPLGTRSMGERGQCSTINLQVLSSRPYEC